MIWQFKVVALGLFYLLTLIVEPVIRREEDKTNRVISTVVLRLTYFSLIWGLTVS
jgi:hypothetical protein